MSTVTIMIGACRDQLAPASRVSYPAAALSRSLALGHVIADDPTLSESDIPGDGDSELSIRRRGIIFFSSAGISETLYIDLNSRCSGCPLQPGSEQNLKATERIAEHSAT